jgi:hypothetical protein
VRLLAVLTVLVFLAGCGAEPPATVPFTKVELGAVPARIAVDGDGLLVGVHKDGKPGLLRYRAGRTTDIPLTPATGYGAQAHWYSVATNGREILAVGGKTGGAHGNVRWSVWRTTANGVAEQPQPFSTFGGTQGGVLVGGVLPATGPLVIGTWTSHSVGADVMVWTTDGQYWNRMNPAGTSLESTRAAVKFPESAVAHGTDVLIAGWQFAGGKQEPVVWTLRDGKATLTKLPDAGRAGMAVTVSCVDTCAIAGKVDGRLAVWRQSGNTWRRLTDVPDAPVGDDDRPVPPVGDTLVYSDRGVVRVATLGGDVRDAAGPAGVVTAVARVGDTTYVLAGPDEDNQTLWRAG